MNAVQRLPNVSGAVATPQSFEALRSETLQHIKRAADILRTAKDTDLETMKVIFKSEANTREFPFWNALNGPVDDALWHVGQVVTFRRSSGNPYNNKANLLTGRVGQ